MEKVKIDVYRKRENLEKWDTHLKRNNINSQKHTHIYEIHMHLLHVYSFTGRNYEE